jgi:hypothetical protein
MRAATRRLIKAQKVNASGDARNLDTGDGSISVEQETVAAASDVRPPQGEPRKSSATRPSLIRRTWRRSQQVPHDSIRRGSTEKLYFGAERSSSHHPFNLSTSRKSPPAVSQGLELLLRNPEVQIVQKKTKKHRYKKRLSKLLPIGEYACEDTAGEE